MDPSVRLSPKRIAFLAFSSLIPLVIMLFLIHNEISTSLQKVAFSNLSEVHETKKRALNNWFSSMDMTLHYIGAQTQNKKVSTPQLLKKYTQSTAFEGFYLTDIHGRELYRKTLPSGIQEPELTKELLLKIITTGRASYIQDISLTNPHAYIAHTINDVKGKPSKILFGFINFDEITRIIRTDNTNWQTQESYIVGQDFGLRTQLRIEPTRTKVDTVAIRDALNSGAAKEIIQDYRDVEVYSVYSPFIYSNLKWAMATEVDLDEVSIPLTELQRSIIFVFILLAVVTLLTATMILYNLKKYEDKLHHRANYDALTGMPNRLLLHSYLKLNFEKVKQHEVKSLAVLFIDVDNFKDINDTYGHSCGDTLLRELADRLHNTLRSNDFVARVGGDEFVVVLNRFRDTSNLLRIAQKLNQAFSNPVYDNNTHNSYQVSCSIGIALYQEKQNIDDLLKNADAAMYIAKERGRDTAVLYEDYMTEKVKRFVEVKHLITDALDFHKFQMVFQPQYSAKGKKLVGFEALIRLENGGEVISPVDFIPVAEKSMQIKEIDRWVVEHVIVKLYQLKPILPPRISINVSAFSIAEDSFIDYIEQLLQDFYISGESIELEITEGVMLHYDTQLKRSFARLRSLGITLSIDDFGTGYSSLQYLKAIPVRSIKIDASFIKNLTQDPTDKKLVNAIISMGHAYGYEIIAEGVETQAQFQMLAKMECDIIQGFYLSRPLDEEAFVKLLNQ